VLLAVGDDGVAGQQAVVVEHEVQLDGAFRTADLAQFEDRGAQFDGRGVDRAQLVLEAELMPGSGPAGPRAAHVQQLVEDCKAFGQLPSFRVSVWMIYLGHGFC